MGNAVGIDDLPAKSIAEAQSKGYSPQEITEFLANNPAIKNKLFPNVDSKSENCVCRRCQPQLYAGWKDSPEVIATGQQLQVPVAVQGTKQGHSGFYMDPEGDVDFLALDSSGVWWEVLYKDDFVSFEDMEDDDAEPTLVYADDNRMMGHCGRFLEYGEGARKGEVHYWVQLRNGKFSRVEVDNVPEPDTDQIGAAKHRPSVRMKQPADQKSMFDGGDEGDEEEEEEDEEDEDPPLFEAVKENDMEKVKELLDAKAAVSQRNLDDYDPLIIAACYGHNDITQLLLDRKADPNFVAKDGSSAILCAALEGLGDTVKLLLNYPGVDPNGCGAGSVSSPLYVASQEGKGDIVNLLLAAKADCELTVTSGPVAGVTPLFIACQVGHVDILSSLLVAKANPNRPNPKGVFPLHSALGDLKHMDVLTHLLTHGADCNKTLAKTGMTPLLIAQRQGLVEGVRVLIGAKADLNRRDAEQWSPALLAAHMGDLDVLELLMRAKCDLEATREGTSAREILKAKHREDLDKLLQDSGKAKAAAPAPAKAEATPAPLKAPPQSNADIQRRNADRKYQQYASASGKVSMDGLRRMLHDNGYRERLGDDKCEATAKELMAKFGDSLGLVKRESFYDLYALAIGNLASESPKRRHRKKKRHHHKRRHHRKKLHLAHSVTLDCEAKEGDDHLKHLQKKASINVGDMEAECLRIFKQFDKSNNGSLSRSELGECLKALGLNLSAKELRSYSKSLVKQLHHDKDGEVTFEEFFSFYRECLSSSVQRQKYLLEVQRRSLSRREKAAVKAAWAKYDADHDGSLGRQEVVAIIRQELGMQLNRVELDIMIEELFEVSDTKHLAIDYKTFKKFFRHCLVNQEKKSYYKKLAYLTNQEVKTAQEQFAKYDRDSSGVIDAKEVGALLRDLGLNLSKEQLQELSEHVTNPGGHPSEMRLDLPGFTRFFRRCLASAEKTAAFKHEIMDAAKPDGIHL